jgi:O-methyltransferase
MKLTAFLSEYRDLFRLQKKIAGIFPSYKQQKEWIEKLRRIDKNVETAHNPSHILQFLSAIFELQSSVKGCIVEAGAYKGGGTAKISLAARYAGRDLYVFDSFRGLPENEEEHTKSVLGHSIEGWFKPGNFQGSLEEVKQNVTMYGDIGVCNFIPGWFEDTMPSFSQPVALAYLDVDLASSTRTCLKYLYPLITPGGAIYSQDGDFPLVIDVFKDEKFWKEEVGCITIPEIKGLGKKITIIQKQHS